MKRFLPLLIILPLLIWVGCEDDTETPFPFSDEFVKHRLISWTSYSYTSDMDTSFNSSLNITWNGLNAIWNGNSDNGQFISYRMFNEYGSITQRLEDSTNYDLYTYLDDGWRLSSHTVFRNDETVSSENYIWDGLHNKTTHEIFNQYGNRIAFLYGSQNIADNWLYNTLSEDGRRMLVIKWLDQCNGNQIELDNEIWKWNGNKVEILSSLSLDDNCNIIRYTNKYIFIYDEFYNVVSSTWYYWDNDDWVLLKVETWEYDYNSPFTPITLTP